MDKRGPYRRLKPLLCQKLKDIFSAEALVKDEDEGTLAEPTTAGDFLVEVNQQVKSMTKVVYKMKVSVMFHKA